MGPFSREKGRGEVRGFFKKEVEEFPPPPPISKEERSQRKKRGAPQPFAASACFLFRCSTHHTRAVQLDARRESEKGERKRQELGGQRHSPFFSSSTKQKTETKNDARLTFKTSCSNVDSSTSSTARTARPAERADAAEWAGLRAAGKAVELRLTRWEGRARPNVAVADDEEHRAEDSDAEIVALEAGLAVAARPVAVAFIDAIIVGAVARP